MSHPVLASHPGKHICQLAHKYITGSEHDHEQQWSTGGLLHWLVTFDHMHVCGSWRRSKPSLGAVYRSTRPNSNQNSGTQVNIKTVLETFHSTWVYHLPHAVKGYIKEKTDLQLQSQCINLGPDHSTSAYA